MKYLPILFMLFSVTCLGQNELSLNNQAPQSNERLQVDNNAPQMQVVQTGNQNYINPEVNQMNVDQQQETNIQVQVNTQQRSGSSGSASYSSGTSRKKSNVFKDITRKINVFQYKHQGKKKFRHRGSRHSKRHILRCF